MSKEMLDITKPIDITAVNNTRVKYSNLLVGLNMLAANDVLKDCSPELGVQSSVILGKTEHGTISKKYDGVFTGDKQIGEVVPRTLMVYPVVAEMADEPERYRRSFITDVAGGLWEKKHPFELWLLQYGIGIASEDLHNVLFNAKLSSGKTLKDSFNGWFTIIDTDITSGKISAANKNLYATGALTRANCGEKLLEMWRAAHTTLRNKNTNFWVSQAVGDLYDDWYRDEHDNPPFIDQAGQMFLEGTNKKVVLKRTSSIPVDSQRVLLTSRANMRYGTDKLSDMKNMKGFNSGNPYLYTAAMKYVFGTQFVSVNQREFLVNDQAGDPSASGSASA